jgi:hypothetical protein
MTDLHDEHDPLDVVDGIDDAVVALSHPISIGMAGQLFAAGWAGLSAQRLDARDQAPSIGLLGYPLEFLGS